MMEQKQTDSKNAHFCAYTARQAFRRNALFVCCLFFIFFTRTFFCYAQTNDLSPVWKITDPKSGNIVYIGGSMHVMRKGDAAYLPPFDSAFSDAGILVFETDANELNNSETQKYLLKNMFLPDEKTLGDVLSSKAVEHIQNLCKEQGVPFAYVNRLKPALAMSMFEVMSIKNEGFLEKGVDARYAERAAAENKKIAYLESIESQIDLLLNMGAGYEDEYVLYSVDDMKNAASDLDEITEAWRSGKPDSMEKQLAELQEATPAVYDDLLKKRNDAWMPQILQYFTTGEKEFVIVGLLHLYGVDGLITQLKNAGFSVEQLRR
ncbi:MAG: hypothetical protein Ta2A_20100 [Treponemataceae bacterium]|nr:MAG: hypothetical protein Ta2A_20100 [Treponemataceae bacterium]